ncbi:MAG TPA: 3-phosphoshikimate 1-carboxyvinyltransferase, partial [Firmicutes bacterium]|nr:3-phosphoshikimate 1-carboxyvinyltransferase [Bacillota bacterium]
MDNLFIGPARLRGTVLPPPSKSIGHRVLIAASLAEMCSSGVSSVRGIGPETSDDLAATISCLESLFACGKNLTQLNCRESGSTLRFLIPVAAALGKDVLFVGAGRLSERPLSEYGEILAGNGITLEFAPQGGLPLRISGELKSGDYYVPGTVSSQYVTGLLLALPLLAGDSSIWLTSPLESAPYVQITEGVLEQFGIVVERIRASDGGLAGWKVPGDQTYRIPAMNIDVEADYSQAAFWLVAAHLGHLVKVIGLNPASSQGDRAVVALLSRLGEESSREIKIDVSQIPDLVPPLAVAACVRPARTVFAKAGRLRLKESDRLHALTDGLGRLGAEIKAEQEQLVVTGGRPLSGGKVSTYNDHRIAMALAIAALHTQRGVVMEGAGAVKKS